MSRMVRKFTIRNIKLEHGCTDCGYNEDASLLEFDHVPGRGTKLFNIGGTGRGRELQKLKAEIEKCDVVCRSCHRARTKKRLTTVGWSL